VIEPCRHLTQEGRQHLGLELRAPKTRIAHTRETAEGETGFNVLGV
jgi:hypothetical protein